MLQSVTVSPTSAAVLCYNTGVVKGHHPMHTITERTSKPEIISAALELTDSQAATISRLQQQQRLLIAALAVLAVCYIM